MNASMYGNVSYNSALVTVCEGRVGEVMMQPRDSHEAFCIQLAVKS